MTDANRGVPTTASVRGELGSLPLADLLQVEAQNRFSGLVKVLHDGDFGMLFFVEGELVHAESPGAVGEAAVQAVIPWADGQFELVPFATAPRRTITRPIAHVLLDAHRTFDEARRAARPSAPRPSTPPLSSPSRPPTFDAVEQARRVAGLTELVRFARDGRPVGDNRAEADELAARGLYLVLNHAVRVSETFGLGELRTGSVQTSAQGFVVLQNAGKHLCFSVTPGTSVASVESQVRAILARPGGS